MPKKVLGKGLEALIPQTVSGEAPGGERVFHVPIDTIEANPQQPRKSFDDERLRELSESIREDGILQPVVVRRRGDRYQLILGERRLQAAHLAGVPTIPVIVKNVEEVDALRLALVENIQRENLNAVEVAEAYRILVGTYGLSQAELARLVGRDRSSVANTLRLLNLPEGVRTMIRESALSEGHARALLGLPTQKEQLAMARRVVEQGMTVRQTEAATGLVRERRSHAPSSRPPRPPHLVDLERAFSSCLGTKVAITEKRGGRGTIAIEFYSHEDFERLAEAMNVPLPR